MKATRVLAACAVCATALAGGAAAAPMIHPTLGAQLSGMGEKGVVNLTLDTAKKQLCWTFDLSAAGLTGASIRDAAGMSVAALGSMYTPKGCATTSTMALDEIGSKPGSYHVWVDTKGHPGDLRGTLFAGMAHLSNM